MQSLITSIRYFETDENNVSVAQSVLPKLKTKDNKGIEVPDFVTCKMGIKECREHGLMTQFDVQQVEQASPEFPELAMNGPPHRTLFLYFANPSHFKNIL